jgi:hypothetical protein
MTTEPLIAVSPCTILPPLPVARKQLQRAERPLVWHCCAKCGVDLRLTRIEKVKLHGAETLGSLIASMTS